MASVSGWIKGRLPGSLRVPYPGRDSSASLEPSVILGKYTIALTQINKLRRTG
jgi:hypothetical protein